jgi:DNA-binding transcriptional MerR regulator
MDEYISIDKLIKQAKSKGVNFGNGDPYNRLRYYTKIGWLPHMTRRADKQGKIKGHYPTSSIESLLLIEKLKSEGATNEQISKELANKSKKDSLSTYFKSPEIRKQALLYSILIILIIIFANEIGIIKLGKTKDVLTIETKNVKQIYNDGTAFVPKNQSKVFVNTNTVRPNSKVYVTFTQNYSPATRYWVSKVEEQKGFLVELDTPVSNNVEFNWWLSQ